MFEKDDGGEGSSNPATAPPAPEAGPPSEYTSDEEEGADEDINTDEGGMDARPKTSESEVS